MESLKQVRANQKGFYKDRLIQDGEVFAVGEEETGLWFDDVDPKPANNDANSNYSRMNKEALTAAAVAKDIELNGSETKAQLVELLEESDLLS
ncbi:hypothetical protein F909_03909 [Acinetobacter sp. ANC 3929]|uniref:hypothetical protein n=1 Tax=Acinetobacter sp. ANC 3929 TaxID=1217707 RepID=UPI0002CDA3C6|nr:hypothetical protein [Acinetobacter sp. ANC 3929]ENW78223.1 hypothetical protein F909_03909 [Acinetobacter sp. ANC 3929]